MLPTRSMDRTRNSWFPTKRPVYSLGEAHSANGAPSREHPNLEPGSFEEKAKLALVAVVVPLGPLASRVVWGALASTVQVWLTGASVVLPAASVARTSKVCSPLARPV